MRLTLYTDYALRVLIYTALNPQELSTIDGISSGYGISKNHLRKVVNDLSRCGFVETLQGRNGGIRLSRLPEEIGVGAVVRAMEQDLSLVECFGPSGESNCRIVGGCALRSMMHDALGAFLATLDRYNLADLVRPRHALAAMLGIEAPSPPQRRRALVDA